MARSFISAAERELIRSAVLAGAEIVCLEGAPGFRFIPFARKPEQYGKPSKRALSFKRKPHMRKIKTWSPQSLTWGEADLRIAMAGDPPALTAARRAYADGDPEPLRTWLSSRPKTITAPVEFQLELAA